MLGWVVVVDVDEALVFLVRVGHFGWGLLSLYRLGFVIFILFYCIVFDHSISKSTMMHALLA